MLRPALVVLLLASARAFAGPMGAADLHAAPATGFPGAYLTTIRLSLAGDPFFASRLLDATQLHLKSVAVMTQPRAVGAYLAQAVTAGQGDLASVVKPALGVEPMTAPRASALLIANALARPEQFREILSGLETLKPGLGKRAAQILRETKGAGSPRLIDQLRAAGDQNPQGDALTYGADGRINVLFDGSSADFGRSAGADVGVPPGYTGEGPDGRPRRSGLLLAPPRP